MTCSCHDGLEHWKHRAEIAETRLEVEAKDRRQALAATLEAMTKDGQGLSLSQEQTLRRALGLE